MTDVPQGQGAVAPWQPTLLTRFLDQWFHASIALIAIAWAAGLTVHFGHRHVQYRCGVSDD